jgi:hypothetical protein
MEFEGMSVSGKPRKLSRQVVNSPGSAPLKLAYEQAQQHGVRTWEEVEPIFLRAMEAFDQNVVSWIA